MMPSCTSCRRLAQGSAKRFEISYPKRGGLLTPKGHIVEKHVHDFARRYRALGVFGEDGMESLHPLDARARMLVRTMKNQSRIIEFSSRQAQKNYFSLV